MFSHFMLLRLFAFLMSFASLPAADQASHFAALAVKGISKEFPHKLDHIIKDAANVKGPRALHPAFYGCFDWHSSVHGHWMLVRLLKKHPDLPEASRSEERRVGKECRSRWSPDHEK